MTGEDEITLHRPIPVVVGDRVEKVAGYKWPGIVVAVFNTLSGEKRYVVECTALEVAGALHIYSGSQLRKVTGVDRPAPASHVPFAAGTLAVCTELGAQLAERGPRVFQKHPELQERCQQMLDDCANRGTKDD